MPVHNILERAANKLYAVAYADGFTWGITRQNLFVGSDHFFIANDIDSCIISYYRFNDEELTAIISWLYEDVPEYEFDRETI